jgi:hypothetical protein
MMFAPSEAGLDGDETPLPSLDVVMKALVTERGDFFIDQF